MIRSPEPEFQLPKPNAFIPKARIKQEAKAVDYGDLERKEF